jgi:hypothetical protein
VRKLRVPAPRISVGNFGNWAPIASKPASRCRQWLQAARATTSVTTCTPPIAPAPPRSSLAPRPRCMRPATAPATAWLGCARLQAPARWLHMRIHLLTSNVVAPREPTMSSHMNWVALWYECGAAWLYTLAASDHISADATDARQAAFSGRATRRTSVRFRFPWSAFAPVRVG